MCVCVCALVKLTSAGVYPIQHDEYDACASLQSAVVCEVCSSTAFWSSRFKVTTLLVFVHTSALKSAWCVPALRDDGLGCIRPTGAYI